jgi:hypothetical protein
VEVAEVIRTPRRLLLVPRVIDNNLTWDYDVRSIRPNLRQLQCSFVYKSVLVRLYTQETSTNTNRDISSKNDSPTIRSPKDAHEPGFRRVFI